MNTSIAPRLASLAIALTLTLAMLGGIDSLARNGHDASQMAQQSQPAKRA